MVTVNLGVSLTAGAWTVLLGFLFSRMVEKKNGREARFTVGTR